MTKTRDPDKDNENDCKDKNKDNENDCKYKDIDNDNDSTDKDKDIENDCNYTYKDNENDCKDKNKDNENDKESFSVKSSLLKYSWRDLSAQTCVHLLAFNWIGLVCGREILFLFG